MNYFEIKLVFERSTKGTHLYKAATPGRVLKSIYIQREAFDGDPPPVLILSINLPKSQIVRIRIK